MEYKQIDAILAPQSTNWVGDGFKVHNFFPAGHRIGKKMSPFYLMDFNAPTYFEPTDKPRGVDVHPHRGFETVTIAFKGEVAHHDSYGNSGIIKKGDVQWMTAASGVLHKEYHSEDFSKQGGWFSMAQIWVNLPAKYKMTEPKYQGISNDSMGKLIEEVVRVDVIAGNLKGVKGAASTFTPIEMYVIHLKKDSSFSFDIDENFNCGILSAEGTATINSSLVEPFHFILFKQEGKTIQVESKEDTTLLVLAGEPINEPIAQYGPFLMNTADEIHQAMVDFQHGKFGTLD